MNAKIKLTLRISLIAVYCFIFYKYIQNRDFLWFIDNFNLLIHEGGHMFFYSFGELLSVMGGTIFQLLVPFIALVIFIKKKDYFSISFSLFWLGTNMFNIARYLSDATNQFLPLLHLGTGEPIHDWNYLLSRFGQLENTLIISDFVYTLGYICIFVAIVTGIHVSFREYKSSKIKCIDGLHNNTHT